MTKDQEFNHETLTLKSKDIKFIEEKFNNAIELKICAKTVGSVRCGRFLYFEPTLNRVFLEHSGVLWTIDVRPYHANEFKNGKEFVIIRHEGLLASDRNFGHCWHKIHVEWTSNEHDILNVRDAMIASVHKERTGLQIDQ